MKASQKDPRRITFFWPSRLLAVDNAAQSAYINIRVRYLVSLQRLEVWSQESLLSHGLADTSTVPGAARAGRT